MKVDFGLRRRGWGVTVEGGFVGHGREIVFDAIGLATFIIGCVLLWLMFSKEVRDYVHKTA